MNRVMMLAGGYLLMALMLEMAVFSQCLLVAPPYLRFLFDIRLLALGGILAGLLRGEVEGMLFALAAALLFSFSQQPGTLGPSIVSFVTVAGMAGLLGRSIVISGFAVRALVIFLMLFIERLLWNLVRLFFWTESPFTVPWLSLVLTALIGSGLFVVVFRRFRRADVLIR